MTPSLDTELLSILFAFYIKFLPWHLSSLCGGHLGGFVRVLPDFLARLLCSHEQNVTSFNTTPPAHISTGTQNLWHHDEISLASHTNTRSPLFLGFLENILPHIVDGGQLNTCTHVTGASQVVLVVENLPANAGDIRDTGWSLGPEEPLEEGMATHSSFPAWRIPWTEEPGGLHRVGKESDATEATEHRRRHSYYHLTQKHM